ncbi:ribosome biogenesis GTPase Der [Bacteroidota bacterium]
MFTPVVIIVGRPNVGKSTLFNRLTSSTNAIVDDVSGVTRDRLYGECEWNGKKFSIIDTGGYVPESEELFEVAIREQIQIGISEANSILFVVDGKTGLTPIDREIARIIRTSNKPTYLLVNKLDNPSAALYTAEFYNLGIRNVFDVSAINGRKLGDVLDLLVEEISFTQADDEEDDNLKIAIIGRPNVGKSSLVNSLLNSDRSIVTDIPGTTRDSINSILKYFGEEIILIDTAGLRKKAKVKENIEFYSTVRTFRTVAESDVAIILIDAKLGLENQDQKIVDEAVRRRKGVIIAVNKWDLIEKNNLTAKHYEANIRKKLGSKDYIPIIFISAKTKQRIYKLIELAKNLQAERRKKIQTNDLNKKLLKEIEEKPPPATPIGKEVKIKYITQVGENYPVFLFFANEVKHIPDSYKRYLEKLVRKCFKFDRVPITLSFRNKNPDK